MKDAIHFLKNAIDYRNQPKFEEKFKKSTLPDGIKAYVLKKLEEDQNSVYKYYPYFFAEPLGYDNYQVIDTLCYASFLHTLSVLCFDKISDGQISKEDVEYNIIAMHAIEKESLKVLNTELTSTIDRKQIWNIFDQRHKEWYASYKLEYKIKSNELDIVLFEKLSTYKVAMSLVPLDIMKELSSCTDESIYEKVIEINNLFYISYQIQDDINDFKEDIKNNQYNYAVSKTKQALRESGLDDSNPTLQVMYVYVFDELYNTAMEYINKALNLCLDIKAFFLETRIRLVKLLFEERMTKKHIECLNKEIKFPFENEQKILDGICSKTLISKPLNYVLQNWVNKYLDINHRHGTIPAKYLITQDDLFGDTFQRSMVTSHLIELQGNNNFLEPIIKKEQEYFLTCLGIDKEGWSYYPMFQELPYDSDDLGQMLQSFNIYLNDDEYTALFKKPIDLFLKRVAQNENLFITWISCNRYFTELDFYTKRYWRVDKVDLAISANIGYGLCIARERTTILNNTNIDELFDINIKYLANKQNNDGSFSDLWYGGNYYPTYAILRFLYKVNKPEYQYIIDNAKNFVLSTQNANGSFGKEKHPYLHTAQAILICLLQEKNSQQEIEVVLKAGAFLEKTMPKDGGYEPSPLFQVSMNLEGKVNTYLYPNKIVTSSFCALAIEKYKKLK